MNNVIKEAISNTKIHLPDHYQSLLGERPGGSTWGRPFTKEDFELEWHDATDKVDESVRADNCMYFRLSPADVARAFPDRKLQAIPLSLLDESEWDKVRLRAGAHGVELVYEGGEDGEEFDPEAAEDEAWLIVGTHETNRDTPDVSIVFTAHPGPLMKSLPADFAKMPYAVKLR